KEAGIDDIVRGLTRSGWFCSVYEGRLPGTGMAASCKRKHFYSLFLRRSRSIIDTTEGA
ncbi:hypothetical protein Tco_1523603, partial [Tanacetum coccineum]